MRKIGCKENVKICNKLKNQAITGFQVLRHYLNTNSNITSSNIVISHNNSIITIHSNNPVVIVSNNNVSNVSNKK